MHFLPVGVIWFPLSFDQFYTLVFGSRDVSVFPTFFRSKISSDEHQFNDRRQWGNYLLSNDSICSPLLHTIGRKCFRLIWGRFPIWLAVITANRIVTGFIRYYRHLVRQSAINASPNFGHIPRYRTVGHTDNSYPLTRSDVDPIQVAA